MSPRHRVPPPARRRPGLAQDAGAFAAALGRSVAGLARATAASARATAALAVELARLVPVHQWRELRRPRALAGLALVLAFAVGGTGIALATGRGSTPATTVADDRATAYDRANRDYARPTDAASASPSVSPSASASPVPTTATPSPAAPTTTAPKPTPTPKKTTAPAAPKPTTPAAVPAGCSSYSGNQLIACRLLPSFGFATSEMSALVPMWTKESSWDETAENPSSGAYGIPQALPGSKMATAGSDWQTNPATQIKWGLGYIRDRYGSPSDAWAFWQNNGWY